MNTITDTPKAYRSGDTAVLPGEYIECDKDGTITMSPSVKVADVEVGQKFPTTAAYWKRYGRI